MRFCAEREEEKLVFFPSRAKTSTRHFVEPHRQNLADSVGIALFVYIITLKSPHITEKEEGRPPNQTKLQAQPTHSFPTRTRADTLLQCRCACVCVCQAVGRIRCVLRPLCPPKVRSSTQCNPTSSRNNRGHTITDHTQKHTHNQCYAHGREGGSALSCPHTR
jgi:hypothetical protein